MKTKQRDHSLLSTRCSSQFLKTADMTPLFISVLLAAMSQKDNVLQPEGDETQTEGDTVTLDCLYNSSPYLFWYKQDVHGPPKYMTKSFSKTVDKAPEFENDRFDAAIEDKSVPLKIQKLHVSDSAVYYCALYTLSTSKLTLGRNTIHENVGRSSETTDNPEGH
uniref:Ig-like domain-containing protein n=1 Tax=Anabas testudineus TaxID=64144 RepID=A0A3Q1J2L8_ANATE